MPLISVMAVIYIFIIEKIKIKKKVILFSLQHFIAPFLILLPLLQSLVPRACKQGSKIKLEVLQRKQNYCPS